MTTDEERLKNNKWTILDRAQTVKTLAYSFAEGHYTEFDRDIFYDIANAASKAIERLTDEIKRIEGRE